MVVTVQDADAARAHLGRRRRLARRGVASRRRLRDVRARRRRVGRRRRLAGQRRQRPRSGMRRRTRLAVPAGRRLRASPASAWARRRSATASTPAPSAGLTPAASRPRSCRSRCASTRTPPVGAPGRARCRRHPTRGPRSSSKWATPRAASPRSLAQIDGVTRAARSRRSARERRARAARAGLRRAHARMVGRRCGGQPHATGARASPCPTRRRRRSAPRSRRTAPSLATGEVLSVAVAVHDDGSGLDPASVALTLDGAPVDHVWHAEGVVHGVVGARLARRRPSPRPHGRRSRRQRGASGLGRHRRRRRRLAGGSTPAGGGAPTGGAGGSGTRRAREGRPRPRRRGARRCGARRRGEAARRDRPPASRAPGCASCCACAAAQLARDAARPRERPRDRDGARRLRRRRRRCAWSPAPGRLLVHIAARRLPLRLRVQPQRRSAPTVARVSGQPRRIARAHASCSRR